MINRFQFVAHINNALEYDKLISTALSNDKVLIESSIKEGTTFTVAMFRLENMLYLYYESEKEMVCPSDMFPAVTKLLDGGKWQLMKNVYYTFIPKTLESWARKEKKKRIAKIGKLLPDKIDSYIKYHDAFMEEGLLDGEKHLFISLLGNTLFLYSEDPAEMVHLRRDCNDESTVINEWRALNPKGHFDHEFSGEANFIILDDIFSLGREDFFNE